MRTTTSHVNGVLCVGGDWACAHGDFAGLGDVARKLADRSAAPLSRELVELARACRCDPERAVALWGPLKQRVSSTRTSPAR